VSVTCTLLNVALIWACPFDSTTTFFFRDRPLRCLFAMFRNNYVDPDLYPESNRLLAWRLFLACNRLLSALPGTGIRLCPLTANRKATTMPQSSIAANVHESLDTELYLGSKLTLNLVLVLDHSSNRTCLLIRPIVRMHIRVNIQFLKNFDGP
jgi:hypothetical protein